MIDSSEPSERELAVTAFTGAWQVGLLVGIVMLALGLVIAFRPTTSLNVLCVLIGIFVLLAGVFRLIRSLDTAEVNRVLTAVLGIVLIVIGVVLIRHLHLTRVIVAFVVGLAFIVQGSVDLVIGFSGEAREGRVWTVIVGLISLAAGVIIVAVPENSITFLATLVGIWFAIIGALQVIAAFVFRHELNRAGSS
jgi:uncharacterized membrane protein HdeD (DUF308 family)